MMACNFNSMNIILWHTRYYLKRCWLLLQFCQANNGRGQGETMAVIDYNLVVKENYPLSVIYN